MDRQLTVLSPKGTFPSEVRAADVVVNGVIIYEGYLENGQFRPYHHRPWSFLTHEEWARLCRLRKESR